MGFKEIIGLFVIAAAKLLFWGGFIYFIIHLYHKFNKEKKS